MNYLLQPKLDALIENFANMSSHVTSIENDWTKYKQTALDFEENSMKINAEVSTEFVLFFITTE